MHVSWQTNSHQVDNVQVPARETFQFKFWEKLLPCWKFHEHMRLSLQVFRPCASRARLHRNLPTTLFTLGFLVSAAVISSFISLTFFINYFVLYLNPQVRSQLEPSLEDLTISALSQGLAHVEQVHREDVRVAVLGRLVPAPTSDWWARFCPRG